MLISPLTSIWRLIQSFFPGSSQEPNCPPSEVPTNAQQPSTSANRASDNDRQSTTRRREPTFYKREGNVFRINNQSDEDENNTWNGNSTQQM
ncbi:UBX domain-containing protein 4, partial [Stegodyphus mimosarum]